MFDNKRNINYWFDGKNDPMTKIAVNKDVHDFADCVMKDVENNGNPDASSAKNILKAVLFKYMDGDFKQVLSELNFISSLDPLEEDGYVDQNYNDDKSRYYMILALRSTEQELALLAVVALERLNMYLDTYGPSILVPFKEDDDYDNERKEKIKTSADDILYVGNDDVLALLGILPYAVSSAASKMENSKKKAVKEKEPSIKDKYCKIEKVGNMIYFTPVDPAEDEEK